jgi:hypothetical protein
MLTFFVLSFDVVTLWCYQAVLTPSLFRCAVPTSGAIADDDDDD